MTMRRIFPMFRTRRQTVRCVLFLLWFSGITFGSICTQMNLTRWLRAEQDRLYRAVLVRMTEESCRLCDALDNKDAPAVLHYTDTLSAYAAMPAAVTAFPEEGMLCRAVADTVQYYQTLSQTVRTAGAVPDRAYWIQCTGTVTDHLAALALMLTERQDPWRPTDAERRCADDLSALCDAFRTETVRIPASVHPGYRFARETAVTQAEARTALRSLIGSAASFLTAECTDTERGLYLFSCRSGFALVSQNGGHLLSYALFPRSASSELPTAAHLLTDEALEAAASAFLKKAAIPVRGIESWEDSHGVRTFRIAAADDRTVTVGIRMHDGAVVACEAEDYYRIRP